MSAGCERCARLEALLREAQEEWLPEKTGIYDRITDALKPDPAIAAARQEHAKVAPSGLVVCNLLPDYPHEQHSGCGNPRPAPGDTEPEIERVPRG